MSAVNIQAKDLQSLVEAIFERAGMSEADAAIEAEVLVWANLRGIDSHGVLRVKPYLDYIKTGEMNPTPKVRILKESPAITYLEADRGFGAPITARAMRQAIQKARNVGIGWTLLRNITHQGALGYYTLMAARENMVGIAMVSSPPNMAPWGAKAQGLHNSPLAIAVPAKRHLPVSLDMATSIAAAGKIMVARDKGVPLPPGWALDANGNPTTDPKEAVILCPAGGAKGSGLAFLLQCLTSLMADHPLIVPALKKGERPYNQNSAIAAIDISFFIDAEKYASHVDDQIDAVKELPHAEGFAEVLVPGEPENRTLGERSATGIPIPDGTAERLRDAAKRFDIELPKELRE